MVDDKLVKLLTLLHNRTNEGAVNWERTAYKTYYLAVFPGFTVQIGEENPYDDEVYYVMKIQNEDGDLVEQARSQDFGHKMENAFPVMKELHTGARRRAMGTDQALDSLLKQLE